MNDETAVFNIPKGNGVSKEQFSGKDQRDLDFIMSSVHETRDYMEHSLIPIAERVGWSEDGLNQISFKFRFMAELFRKLDEEASRLAIVSHKLEA